MVQARPLLLPENKKRTPARPTGGGWLCGSAEAVEIKGQGGTHAGFHGRKQLLAMWCLDFHVAKVVLSVRYMRNADVKKY